MEEWQDNSGERPYANSEGQNNPEGAPRRRQRINTRYESVRDANPRNSYGDRNYGRPNAQRTGYERPYGARQDRQERPYGNYGNYGAQERGYGRQERGYGRQEREFTPRETRDFAPRQRSYRDEMPQGNYTDTNYNRRENNEGAYRSSGRGDYNRVEGYNRGGYNRPGQGRPQGGGFGKRKPQKNNPQRQITYEEKYVDPTKPIRLNKYLANAGVCSRREADEFIQAGIVTVNGEVVTELGSRVLPTDIVKFHEQPIRSERKVYILLNKPKDCVTTAEDTHARKTVLDVVKNACSERIYPVGRLDRNTTGVLLLTNDGELASRLTHPKFKKKKIYHATLDKPLLPEDYETIMKGIELDGGEVIIPDALELIKEGDNTQVGIEIHSGQNRVVRRIFEAVGYKVMRLDRVFFAGLTKKNVARGKWRFLTQKEVNMLMMGAYE